MPKEITIEEYNKLQAKCAALQEGLKEAAAHIVKLQKHINELERGNVGHKETRR